MLVGRSDKVQALATAFAAPGLVVVTGPAGIGKTAVVRAGAAAAGRPVLAGGGLRALADVPGMALSRAVGGRLPTHDPVLAAEAVRQRLRTGVLLLDDGQWADRFSLSVALLLSRRAAVVVCVRTLTESSRRLATRLARDARLTLELPPLSDKAAAELIRAVGPLHDAAVSALITRGGGNPLVLREIAQQERDHPDGIPGGPGLPGGFRQVIAAALAELSAVARTGFAVIGLLGRPVPVSVLGDGIGELVAAGLVVLTPAPADETAAAQEPAIAELAFALLPALDRTALHLRVAAHLPPAEAAVHLAAAGETERAVGAARRGLAQAADQTTRIRLALLVAGLRADALPVEDRLELAGAALAGGDADTVARLLPAGLELSEQSADQQIRAAIIRADATLMGADPSAARGLLAAVAALADRAAPGTRDRFAAVTADADLPVDPAASASAAQAVLAGSPEAATAARARLVLGLAVERLGRPGWSADLRRAAEEAAAVGDWAVECRARLALAHALIEHDHPAAAATGAAAFAVRCRERHEFGAALRCEAVMLWALLHVDADLDGVVRTGSAVLAGVAPADVVARIAPLVALALADAGNPRSARRLLERHPGPARLADWTAAELALLAGEDAAAERTAAGLAGSDTVGRFAEMTGAIAAFTAGATATPTIAGVAGAASWQQVAAAWSPVSRREEVRATWSAGAAAGADGDPAAAELLRTAHRLATRSGLRAIASLIAVTLRRAGGSVPGERVGDQGVPTPREREVLTLVADGLSSRAIAAALGLSVATVDSHVRSAMATLGAPTRLAAALRAQELG